MHYTFRYARSAPGLRGEWDSPPWRDADTLEIAAFHKYSLPPLPRTRAKALYDETGIYVHFRVEDSYVFSMHEGYQVPTCQDSCVELFLQPRTLEGFKGYFNFEINCGGHLLLWYITDPGSREQGVRRPMQSVPVATNWLDRVKIYHSMPGVVRPPIVEPTVWTVEFFAPFALLEAYAGALDFSAEPWRGNFFKCGPAPVGKHWAAWSPIDDKLNFHQPKFFAPLRLESAAEVFATAPAAMAVGP